MNYLLIIFVFISYFFLIKRKNFASFLLVIVLAPPMRISESLTFSCHYLFVPFLVYELFIRKKIKIDQLILLYSILVTLFLFSSLSHTKFFNTITLLGALSYLLILIYITQNEELFFEKSLRKFFILAVLLNLGAIIYEFLFPLQAYQFIESYYFTSVKSTAIDNHIEWYGRFVRYPGLFFSPLLLSGFSLYSSFYFLSHRKWLFAILAISLGFFTVSKTFFIGFVVIFFFGVSQFFGKLRVLPVVIPIMILLIIYFLPSIENFLISNDFAGIQDLIDRGVNSRYNLSSQSELLNYYTITYFLESPIIGYGFSILQNVFIGDSVFVDVLYLGGIIGLFIYLLIMYNVKTNMFHLLILIILGLGIDYVFSVVFLPLIILKYDKSLVINGTGNE